MENKSLANVTNEQILAAIKGLVKVRQEPAIVEVSILAEQYIHDRGRLSRFTKQNYSETFKAIGKYTKFWFTDGYQINGYLNQRKVSDITLREEYSRIRAIGKYCEKAYGWLDVTVNAIKPEKPKKKERRSWTDSDMQGVVGACKTLEEKALVLGFLNTGVRSTGMANLLTENVGVDFIRTMEKTGIANHPCPVEVCELLKRVAGKKWVFEKIAAGRGAKRGIGEQSTGNGLSKRIITIAKRAGLSGEKLGAHSIRHFAGTKVANETGSVFAVQDMLGQSSSDVAQGYIHRADSEKNKRIDIMKLSGIKLLSNDNMEIGENKQLLLSTDNIQAAIKAREDVKGLIKDLLPEIPDGIKIRPQLDTDDLRYLRACILEFMSANNEYGSGSKGVQLLNSWLRRVTK